MKFKRYKKNPPLCEAGIGVDYSRGQPMILRCQNKATGLYFPNDDKFCMAAPLCEECFEKISEADKTEEPRRQALREHARKATEEARKARGE